MFPNPLEYAELPALRTNTSDDAPFTKEEIAIVFKNLHMGKARGSDGFDNIIIQQANKRFPILFMELLNKCLLLGTFPDPLKLGAYRTTATSALQVILGIPPLYLQLQEEARVTAIRRLDISLPDTLTTLVPGEVEKGETGWVAHPAECPSEEQISLVDGGVLHREPASTRMSQRPKKV
ncbi:hypothetical protein AVEN_207029-1 [Araneus ventricosus]|uniref:Reverse transcriptase domain-containing protein n=1 Tax=Araneus ventricosus TaxID=182803 RepID=A0A4Y2RWL8_ARAVE|nr:hypothetical protein AVEN_160782-1 [Araneus ventricosus]GBN80131.1 hypothetical protein AVEN_207029-1 [Araneus ventricosus]